jgi:hypothetical protein
MNRFCWVVAASIIQLIDSIVAGNPCDERGGWLEGVWMMQGKLMKGAKHIFAK